MIQTYFVSALPKIKGTYGIIRSTCNSAYFGSKGDFKFTCWKRC